MDILMSGQLEELISGNKNIDEWCESLNKFLPQYEIDTALRIAAFIAQCAHESANFKILRENLNYRAESLMRTWPKHFPNIDIANQYARQPERIANRAYANRMGNGPEESGDGWKFSGKGLIQLTGKNNYQLFANSIGMDLNELPDYLLSFDGATQSACWFWQTNKLNQWADVGDIKTLTKRINGGDLGLEDRIKHYTHALKILNGE